MSVAVGREKCNYYGQYCEAVEYSLPNKFRVQILGMKWNLFEFFNKLPARATFKNHVIFYINTIIILV